jgi:hypothetical protein
VVSLDPLGSTIDPGFIWRGEEHAMSRLDDGLDLGRFGTTPSQVGPEEPCGHGSRPRGWDARSLPGRPCIYGSYADSFSRRSARVSTSAATAETTADRW